MQAKDCQSQGKDGKLTLISEIFWNKVFFFDLAVTIYFSEFPAFNLSIVSFLELKLIKLSLD